MSIPPTAPDAILSHQSGWLDRWSPSRLVLLVIVTGVLLRLAVALTVGLEIDGSYSTVIARRLSLSYFDHPPMHYWLIWLSTHLFGSEAAVVVRLPFILLFGGSTWLMFRLTSRFFGEQAGLWAALAFSLCPAFTFIYSLFITPDGPLLFFLLLATSILSRLIVAEPAVRCPTLHWLAAGACGGAAMLSKYSAAFFFIGAFAYLVTVPRQRRWLRTPGPWIGAAIAAIVFLPVLIWNAEHDWISLAFQTRRALPSLSGSLHTVWGSVLGQMGYLMPWFFLPMAYVLGRGIARGPSDEGRWFFVCFATGPILVFTLLNFWQQGLPHWTMPGWLMTMPLLGAAFATWTPRARQWLGRLAALGFVVTIVAFATIATQARTGLFTELIAKSPIKKIARHDPTLDLFDWTDLGPQLASRGLLTGDIRFIGAEMWSTAGKIGYGLGPGFTVVCVCTPQVSHHFQFLVDEKALIGTNGLIVVRASNPEFNAAFFGLWFAHVDELPDLVLRRSGLPAEEFKMYRGIGFKPN